MATKKAIPRKAVAAVRKMQKEAGVPPKERVPASYYAKDKAADAKKAKRKEKIVAATQPPMMHDVMVDLETTGQGAGCAILSIGAVFFREDKGLGDEFHHRDVGVVRIHPASRSSSNCSAMARSRALPPRIASKSTSSS